MKTIPLVLPFGFLFLVAGSQAAEPTKGYQAKVKVTAATRIDWTFTVSNRSLAKPPANWLGDYRSTQQTYELFVPSTYQAKSSWPLVLFISPDNGPAGWKQWEATCKKHGVLFASPHAAGNGTPGKRRVRIVLDVLDDLRRTYNIDPDRTYISGHSGGARMAGHIGFGLPEYFGGIVPVCAGVELRDESWLRQRARDRLSIAFLTGETDFNRAECERFRGPLLSDFGVRTKVWVGPKVGHAIPAALIPEAFQWLEQDLPRRRALGKKYPASRMAGSSAPSREEWAKLLLKEGKERLGAKETLFSGLMQVLGCSERWEDVPATAEAKKILAEYDAKKEKPWEEDDIAEKRRFVFAQAKALDAYASGPLPAQYAKQRPEMAKEAMKLWFILFKDNPDGEAGQQAKKRIPELKKLLDAKE
jgi:hypothetical protein